MLEELPLGVGEGVLGGERDAVAEVVPAPSLEGEAAVLGLPSPRVGVGRRLVEEAHEVREGAAGVGVAEPVGVAADVVEEVGLAAAEGVAGALGEDETLPLIRSPALLVGLPEEDKRGEKDGAEVAVPVMPPLVAVAAARREGLVTAVGDVGAVGEGPKGVGVVVPQPVELAAAAGPLGEVVTLMLAGALVPLPPGLEEGEVEGVPVAASQGEDVMVLVAVPAALAVGKAVGEAEGEVVPPPMMPRPLDELGEREGVVDKDPPAPPPPEEAEGVKVGDCDSAALEEGAALALSSALVLDVTVGVVRRKGEGVALVQGVVVGVTPSGRVVGEGEEEPPAGVPLMEGVEDREVAGVGVDVKTGVVDAVPRATEAVGLAGEGEDVPLPPPPTAAARGEGDVEGHKEKLMGAEGEAGRIVGDEEGESVLLGVRKGVEVAEKEREEVGDRAPVPVGRLVMEPPHTPHTPPPLAVGEGEGVGVVLGVPPNPKDGEGVEEGEAEGCPAVALEDADTRGVPEPATASPGVAVRTLHAEGVALGMEEAVEVAVENPPAPPLPLGEGVALPVALRETLRARETEESDVRVPKGAPALAVTAQTGLLLGVAEALAGTVRDPTPQGERLALNVPPPDPLPVEEGLKVLQAVGEGVTEGVLAPCWGVGVGAAGEAVAVPLPPPPASKPPGPGGEEVGEGVFEGELDPPR